MATAQPGKSARDASGPARGGAQVEKDKNYNLIAVLHRSLQNAERCAQYCEDAEQAGDDELVEFFEETCDEHKQRADRARELLAARFSDDGAEMSGGVEEDEEEEDEA